MIIITYCGELQAGTGLRRVAGKIEQGFCRCHQAPGSGYPVLTGHLAEGWSCTRCCSNRLYKTVSTRRESTGIAGGLFVICLFNDRRLLSGGTNSFSTELQEDISIHKKRKWMLRKPVIIPATPVNEVRTAMRKICIG